MKVFQAIINVDPSRLRFSPRLTAYPLHYHSCPSPIFVPCPDLTCHVLSVHSLCPVSVHVLMSLMSLGYTLTFLISSRLSPLTTPVTEDAELVSLAVAFFWSNCCCCCLLWYLSISGFSITAVESWASVMIARLLP